MTGGLVVVRPEPGNSMTAARARALGLDVLQQPLFAIEPVDWIPPDPAGFDALLVTSANAIRHAGPGLDRLAGLPFVAVGDTTARAARAAGLAVAAIGKGDVAAAVEAANAARLLHLAGRDHRDAGAPAIIVYASVERAVPAGAARGWIDRIVLLHSARAARRVAALAARDGTDRARIAIAAISAAVLAAAGCGWRAAAQAEVPTDAALIACARERLTDRDAPGISGP